MPDIIALAREWQEVSLAARLGELPPLNWDRVYLPGEPTPASPDTPKGRTTMAFDINNLTPAELDLLKSQGERLLGFTVERAAGFIAESRTEHPEKDEAWHHDDAVGKHEHFLRVDHGWQGAVDVAWPFIKPFAVEMVDAALKAGA